MPRRIVIARPEDKSPQLPFLYHGPEYVVVSNGCLDFSANLLISFKVFARDVQYPSPASHLKGLCCFFSPTLLSSSILNCFKISIIIFNKMINSGRFPLLVQLLQSQHPADGSIVEFLSSGWRGVGLSTVQNCIVTISLMFV